ncbi:hypothetical protein [Sandaracinus amylolyticus]|nr:hypothetical protein [Sandaracinus amylolyticus]
MDTVLHPGPFRAELREGAHVVVDARGVVVARVEGEWPHRTAEAFVVALNERERVSGRLVELDSLLERHDREDVDDLDNYIDYLEERPHVDDWRKLKAQHSALERELKEARELNSRRAREISELRSTCDCGEGASP